MKSVMTGCFFFFLISLYLAKPCFKAAGLSYCSRLFVAIFVVLCLLIQIDIGMDLHLLISCGVCCNDTKKFSEV